MSIDHGAVESRTALYSLHLTALERHSAWAREFASAGDTDLAMGALRDIQAIAAELRPASVTMNR